jgi:Holliday junction resolvase RusA-like endonuclease
MKYLTDQDSNRLNKSIVVWIRGDPIPLQRARSTKRGITYDPQKDLKYQVGIQLKSQINFKYDYSSLDGNLSLDIKFYFEMPASWSAKKKEKFAGKRKGSRPDTSNCFKFYEDVMQDIGIYKDDSQIVAISAEKFYDDGQGARVVITLKEVNETREGSEEAYAKKKTT